VSVLATGGLVLLAAPASAAPAPTPSDTAATESVIVVLADQLGATPPDPAHLPARAGRAHAAQQSVLSRLTGRTPTKVDHYTLGNAFAATVTVPQAEALAADPAVASVVVDRAVAVTPPAAPAGTAAPAVTPAAGAAPVDPAACSGDPGKPQLEPEALQTIGARSDDPNARTAAALGIDGTGVKVGFIADGIDPGQPSFKRPNGTSAIVDYKDFYGDGPSAPTSGAEAFGDASAIAAQGTVTYDVAQFANPAAVSYAATGGHCYIRVVGVAPGASVVALKAGSELLPNSSILQAIDYAVTTAHVDVLNESFGSNVYPDNGARNTIQLFDDAAVQAGVTVTVSTGDAGPTSTIGNPSTDPNVISTGATTDSRIYEQTGYALATAFGNGRWQDDNISSLSSAGITQNGRTIDVSAPGEADWALCEASPNFSGCTAFNGTPTTPPGPSDIQPFGGTSQSAPISAGVAALVIQAYEKTHGGSKPTPAVVKQIITSTARDLGFAGDVQGTGRIDARAAVEAALSWAGAKGVPAGTSPNLSLSTDQLTLQGTPGTTVSGSVTVTDNGAAPLTVVPSTRRYESIGSTQQQTTFTGAEPTVPYPTNAAPWGYQKLTFAVPPGTAVLNTAIRWTSGAGPAAAGPVVRMSLFAPDGTYAANTRPQGGTAPANYGDVLVRQPAAGTWTAVLYTPHTGGYTGDVTLLADPQRALPVGSGAGGAFTLQPGASRKVSVSLPVPPTGGDAVDTLAFGTSAGRSVAVPVVVRAVVPTTGGTGAFAGTITGGNARSYSPAQTFSYAFDVPSGKHDLDVAVTLAKDPGDLLEGVLVDPAGETPSISSNVLPDGSATGASMENTVANPLPGRWRYVVVVQNPVTGKEFAQDFAGSVGFDKVRVSTSAGAAQSVALAAQAPGAATGRQFTVTVTNPGPAPIAVQADPRTTDLQKLQLAPFVGQSTIPLPQSVDDLAAIPSYLVPPGTRQLAVSAASTVPAQVELTSPGGGIDLFGDLRSAQGGSTVSTATVREKAPGTVGQGFWGTYVQEIGPFGNAGAPAGQSTLVATATTPGFDRSVTTSTGDPFLAAVDGPAAPAGTPVVVPAGGSATIQVTITPPAGARGTVSGLLNLVTTPIATPLFATTGDVLATVPYSYQAG
jgi:subtilisin family serine protease